MFSPFTILIHALVLATPFGVTHPAQLAERAAIVLNDGASYKAGAVTPNLKWQATGAQSLLGLPFNLQ